jgi:hypothetical protein
MTSTTTGRVADETIDECQPNNKAFIPHRVKQTRLLETLTDLATCGNNTLADTFTVTKEVTHIFRREEVEAKHKTILNRLRSGFGQAKLPVLNISPQEYRVLSVSDKAKVRNWLDFKASHELED